MVEGKMALLFLEGKFPNRTYGIYLDYWLGLRWMEEFKRELGELFQVIELLVCLGRSLQGLWKLFARHMHSLGIYWNIFLKTGKAWIKGQGKVSWGG